jgi:hypothetical protein
MTANGNGQAHAALADQKVVTGKVAFKRGDTISAVQAGIEGIPVNVEAVYFMGPDEEHPDRKGQYFRIAESVGLMPLLKFAHAASSGLTEDSMEGMAAMYAMVRDCIDPADWDRFERFAIESRAEGEHIMTVVEQAMEVITSRPTARPSGSSSPGRKSSRKSSSGSHPAGSVVPGAAAELEPVSELLLSTG